jgi:hypothetical protein
MGRVGEVSKLGRMLFRGFHIENDFRAMFLGQDRRSAMSTSYNPLRVGRVGHKFLCG